MSGMKHDVLRVKGLHVLRRLFAPMVALYVARARREKGARQKVKPPNSEVLKSLPLFAKWPTIALQKWTESGVMEIHAKGTTIAFQNEPRRSADVFWLLAGKLTQVPNKAELRRCATDFVHLPRNLPKTGPLILPSHFMEGNAKKSLPPLTPAQEQLADSLSFYNAGQLVDVERLILGGERLRALRCQSEVVVLRLSLAACLREIQTLPSAARSATVDAARLYVQRSMAQFSGAPPATSIMSVNPVLAALPMTVLKTICHQLKPFVFLKSEIICGNVFAAEWMYFLDSGLVRIEDSNGAHLRIVEQPFTVIGMHAFVQSCVPDYFDQRSHATAAVYCEMWGLPISVMLSTCNAASRLQCTLAATQLLRTQGVGRLPLTTALRAYACFSDLSEMAVVAIAGALHLRVYTPGETVVPVGRIPAFGILIVAGDVRLHRSVERDTKQLLPGQVLFFCESLVKVRACDAVVSQSSSIILQLTPGLLFEAMEVAELESDEVHVLLRSAQQYVDRTYGAHLNEINKAQYAAAERVKEYKRRQMESLHPNSTASPSAAVPEEVLQNKLFATLEVQLHALQPDEEAAAKFEYFRAGTTATRDDAATLFSSSPPPPPPSPRRSEYFSLDDRGNLITCKEPAQPSTHVVHHQRLPPPQQSVTTAGASQPSGGPDAWSPPLPGFASAPPAAAKTSTVPPRSTPAAPFVLRTSVHAAPPGTKSSMKTPSPRVASLRAAAARIKDEADGVDRKREKRYSFARNTAR
ncbi:hypothetical protein ABB37_07073 [Leptomonas pyrrhocoris]|uniref:Cyclic nucleotide-binding domain-containing protein n=1 Tax=Leptomonas pyrrhocoris TaxID=157538 RepID=A0A0N0DT86_LEPPY|nr:hypothetical protein ABB37_07073 [Leptomonas pyrrhocoris]KPA77142.1 hypothetical protein ABB37_07073 [Leptomonas pyrrhocoris]|eukprot:XP_015655581.1 hypothetical protein ABB37_07073 [Leptomonas pyrrhocoris]